MFYSEKKRDTEVILSKNVFNYIKISKPGSEKMLIQWSKWKMHFPKHNIKPLHTDKRTRSGGSTPQTFAANLSGPQKEQMVTFSVIFLKSPCSASGPCVLDLFWPTKTCIRCAGNESHLRWEVPDVVGFCVMGDWNVLDCIQGVWVLGKKVFKLQRKDRRRFINWGPIALTLNPYCVVKSSGELLIHWIFLIEECYMNWMYRYKYTTFKTLLWKWIWTNAHAL